MGNASRRVVREVNIPMRSYCIPKSPGEGDLLILKAKFYSVPDLNAIAQRDQNKLDASEVNVRDLSVNGRVIFHLKKCCSCD